MSMKPNIKIGDRFLTTSCGWCTVVGYSIYSRIEVEFDGPYGGRRICSGSALKKGQVQNPLQPKRVDELAECHEWHKLFVYDESSPSGLRWRVDRHSGKDGLKIQVRAGDVAGTEWSGASSIYWKTRAGGKRIQCHRVVWEMHNGKITDSALMIDHLDGNGLNNNISNLRLVDRSKNARNVKRSKKSSMGVTGVKLQENTDRKGLPYFYYVAYWRNLDGKEGRKCFSVSKLGHEEAFRLACEYRSRMIAELNEQGAGYTDRHGT